MGWGSDGGGSSETKSRSSDTFVIFRIMSIMLNLLLCNINSLPDLGPVQLYSLSPVCTKSSKYLAKLNSLVYPRAPVCDRGVNVCCVQFVTLRHFVIMLLLWYLVSIILVSQAMERIHNAHNEAQNLDQHKTEHARA